MNTEVVLGSLLSSWFPSNWPTKARQPSLCCWPSGALNPTLSYVGSTSMSLIYVSRANSNSRQGVGTRLTCQRADLSWLLLDPMRVSLLAGSTTAATLRQLGVGQPWTLPWWDCSSSAARQGISRATVKTPNGSQTCQKEDCIPSVVCCRPSTQELPHVYVQGP